MDMLDTRCSDRYCAEEGSYELPAHCLNCGERCMFLVTRGHDASDSHSCPACGVSMRWHFGTIAEARAIRTAQAAHQQNSADHARADAASSGHTG